MDCLSVFKNTKGLYLREGGEPRDNSLRIVVEEAFVNYTKTGSLALGPALAGIFGDAHPIESTEGCRTIELFWKRYAAYLVTEECVAGGGTYEDEAYTGGLLRRYSQSHFLEHLARDTGGHLRPLEHYKLICLNHVIDIASEGPPEIRILSEERQVRDSVQ